MDNLDCVSKTDVAIFIRSLYGGGAERVMLNLANDFADRGFHVDMVLPRAEGEYLRKLSPKVSLVDLKCPRVWTSLSPLVRYLKAKRPKSVLAALHYPCELAILAKLISRVPSKIVVSERNTLSVEANSTKQLSVRLTPLASKLLYPLADEIVAVSQGVAKDLSEITKISISEINVIYNPVLPSRFSDEINQPVTHPWFQEASPRIILGVGRLHPQKDFTTLIKAFAILKKSVDARLVILGTGPEEAKLKTLAHQLGVQEYVDLPGFVENPYAYMARASVFVLSSIYEGLANVLIEALASGTRVVSTDCKSGPSEILKGGKYGFLTPVDDPDSMSQAILQALERDPIPVDPEWLSQFTLDACSKNYLEVLGLYSSN